MEIFLDTANDTEILHILKWGIIDGVTTNQKIFLKEKGVDFETRIKRICEIVNDKPVSVESNGKTLHEILTDARHFSSLKKNIVCKVPMTPDGVGLEAVSQLSHEGIKTNVTIMMNFNQLLLATKAGATYVSLFYNRAKDAGEDGLKIISDYTSWTRNNGYATKLIVGSIRHPKDISNVASAGADIITIPYEIMTKLPYHKKTEETIKEFDEAWNDFLSK